MAALVTRAWATSVSIVLMITICYSKQRALRYWWLYHAFGWLAPLCTTLAIFLASSLAAKDGDPKTRLQEITTLQYSAAIVLLALCIIVSSTNLIRIIRRMYQLKRGNEEHQRRSSISRENDPLIEHNDDDDSTLNSHQASINSTLSGK